MPFGTVIRSFVPPEQDKYHLNNETAVVSIDGAYIYARHGTTGLLNRFNYSDFQGLIEIGSDPIPQKQLVAHPTNGGLLLMISDDGIQSVGTADGSVSTVMDAAAFEAAAGWSPDQNDYFSRVDDDNFLFGSIDSTANAICNYQISANAITQIVKPGFFWRNLCAVADGSGDFLISTWDDTGTIVSAIFKFLRTTTQWRVIAGLGIPGDTVGVAVNSKLTYFTQLYSRQDGFIFIGTSTLPKYVSNGLLVRFDENRIGFPVPDTSQLLLLTGHYTETYLLDASVS